MISALDGSFCFRIGLNSADETRRRDMSMSWDVPNMTPRRISKPLKRQMMQTQFVFCWGKCLSVIVYYNILLLSPCYMQCFAVFFTRLTKPAFRPLDVNRSPRKKKRPTDRIMSCETNYQYDHLRYHHKLYQCAPYQMPNYYDIL